MKKKIIKISLLIILFLLLILLIIFLISIGIKNKYKKILIENDYNNYELSEITDGEEISSCKVKNNVILVEDATSSIWISSKAKKKIILNTDKKTAMVEEGEFKVVSLNYSYINNFFEDSNMKFKYLGKKDGFAVLSFTNKTTLLVTELYLNLETNLVEKIIEREEIASRTIEYKIKVNSVSDEEVKEPDLTEYYVINN